MNSGEQLFAGINGYVQSIRAIDRNRLWSIILIPAVISLVIAVLVGMLAWYTSDDILNYITGSYSFKDYDSRIGNLVELILAILVRGLVLFLYLKLFRYLTLIVLSPMFVKIAGILDRKIEGREVKMNIRSLCYCSFRGIKLALRNFMLEILITFILFFFSLLIIWVVPLLPALLLLIESYFFGMVMMDYSYEKDGLTLQESIGQTRKNAGLAIGNGLVFNVILLFPLLGVMFGPILALVAARVAIDELKNSKFYVNPIHKPI